MTRKSVITLLVMASLTLAGCIGGWGGSSSSKDSAYSTPSSSGSRGGSRGGSQGSAPHAVLGQGGSNLFRLPMSDGQPVTVKSPAVLFFFTSWCGYCKQVMPEFKQMTSRARSQGWRVYGIMVGEGSAQANGFINQYQPNFPVLLDQQSLVARQYGVKGYPTFVIIDDNANIIYNAHELPRSF